MEATVVTAITRTDDKAPAGGRSLAWKWILREVANGMLMMDPMGYGWYWALTPEAQGQSPE
jgi:hypothetical protein